MNDRSTWRIERLIKKEIPLPGAPNTFITRPRLTNDAGSVLEYLHSDRERQNTFLYSNSDVTFEFVASRYDAFGRVLQDHYVVFLSTALKRINDGPTRSRLTPGMIQSIKQDISDALFAYPPRKTEAEVPIREVIIH